MRPIRFSRPLFISLAGAVAVAVLAGTASAQDDASYPSKPIRIVVGFAAGGGNDLVARIVGPRFSEIPRPAGHRREPARSGKPSIWITSRSSSDRSDAIHSASRSADSAMLASLIASRRAMSACSGDIASKSPSASIAWGLSIARVF
jgi:hypothetical protein